MALLSVDDFRLLHKTSVEDAAIELLLDAAELAINERYGEVGADVTEVVDGGLTYITLRRRAASVTSVTESFRAEATTLAGDDYRIRNDRRSLERLDWGTNVSYRWGHRNTVVYTPEDDTAERKRVQAELVELDLNAAPGSSMEQIGAWTEQHQQSSVWNYQAEREAILASLLPVDILDFA